MALQLVAVASLLLGSAFLLMAGALHGLLLAVHGTIAGFSTTELGLLGTGWAFGFVTGCVLIPRVVRRVGHIRAYGALASVGAVTILLNLLIVSPPTWIALRAVSGFCFAGAAMIVESWLNERATRENRGTIFSVYQMVNFAASTAGQLLLAINPPTDYFYFVLGAIFYCLAILPTALSTAATPQPLKTTRFDIGRLYFLLAGFGGRLLPGRHGQRRLRHARSGLRPEDRSRDSASSDADRRRAPRRFADSVSARLAVGPHGSSPRSGRRRHRRRGDRRGDRVVAPARSGRHHQPRRALRRDDLSDVRARRRARQ